MAQRGQAVLKFDPANLDIRTKTLEKTLQPLVAQVTTLANHKVPTGAHHESKSKKTGPNKRVKVLVVAVEKAIEQFVQRVMEIIQDNPDGKNDLVAALDEVKQAGDAMSKKSNRFAEDPCSSKARQEMVDAARALLTAVTRMLIVADMIDVHVLLRKLEVVRGDLDDVRNANSNQELNDRCGKLNQDLDVLQRDTAKRAIDLKDPNQRDDIFAARAVLKRSNVMLQSASKAYIRHPECDAGRMNRDYAYDQMMGALNGMQTVLNGGHAGDIPHGNIGDLMEALNDFDQRVFIDPSKYKDHLMRPSLEEQLERIISGAALIADSGSTRDDRKARIVQECNKVRQALQDLLKQYEENAGRSEPSEELDLALVHLGDRTKELRRHLRRAVVDHISDSFLDTKLPLIALIEAAMRGDQPGVEEAGAMFLEHANKLVEVANLACQMSNSEEGVKMVQYCAAQLAQLAPQVVNAARLLGL